MDTGKIDGKQYAKMLLGGASLLSEHIEEINDLNVFPVPDGDTGTNMVKTLEGGISEMAREETSSIGHLAKTFAHGVLLGARGNSGVILSQIFAGIGAELAQHDEVSARVLAMAYSKGIEKSYSAVQNPTEGTILTVFREATEYACENIDESSSIEDFFKLHIEKAKESLLKTKEILPALAEADVVDSGAAGYLYIALGMYYTLTGKLKGEFKEITKEQTVDISKFTRASKLEFGYCTELLLRLTEDKVDPERFDINELLSILNTLGGQSVVAYKTDDMVKVHVHTFTPGAILTEAQKFGEFLTVKVENMALTHTDEIKPRKKKNKLFGVLTVATGEGICALFKDMGADGIVAGGQSANPSTEEFIKAFEALDCENIIVLPNNKNVFLASKQAAEMYEGAKVHIVPTCNIMQGYGALSVITPGISDIDSLVASAKRAASEVIGAEVTKAVRDVTINGKAIKEGDYIAIKDGEIVCASLSANEAVKQMLNTVDMDEHEIITVFTGKCTSAESRCELTEELEELYPECEVVFYEGGQEIYDYLIAIE